RSSEAQPRRHGLAAATSWNRAGKSLTPLARAIVTRPSSSGWRSDSRMCCWNSGRSSRTRTPRWASATSPGWGGLPPPIRPETEIVWCGARNGRSVMSSPCRGRSPTTLQIADTSSTSSLERGGRIAASRRASIVLPPPGGPTRSTLWAPAAAISSARLACAWPRTSARSRSSAAAARTGARERHRHSSTVAVQQADRVGERRRGEHVEAVDGERLGGVLHGHHERVDPLAPAGQPDRERATDRLDLAVERELADDGVRSDDAILHDARGGEDAEGDRQFERRALLLDVGGRQVHGDPVKGEGETVVAVRL